MALRSQPGSCAGGKALLGVGHSGEEGASYSGAPESLASRLCAWYVCFC